MPIDSSETRRCAYTRCAEPLEYSGQGRPPEYCPDRRWDGNRTCKQLAAAERAGEKAVALDVPLDAFRQAGDRFVPAAQALARQLTDVVTAVGAVRDSAVARIGESETAARTADDRARAAQAEADEARARQLAAEADRDEAWKAATAADRAAAAAKSDRDEAVAQAWQRVTAADHARGAAEALAAEAARRQEQAEQTLAAQATRHDAQVGGLRDELAQVSQHRDVLSTALATTESRATAAEAALAAERNRAESLASELADVRRELADVRNRRDALATNLAAAEAARDAAAVALERAATGERDAVTRLARAEARLDRLVHRAATVTRRPVRGGRRADG